MAVPDPETSERHGQDERDSSTGGEANMGVSRGTAGSSRKKRDDCGETRLETDSNKCAAGLKTLLVEYLLMQNRHLTGEERSAKTREEVREANGGIPILTDLYLAMRSDPLGMIRGLGEVVTCV